MRVASIFDFVDAKILLQTFGTVGLFAIVFAESGLLVGFFLPGDSLLFTAGLFASQGKYGLNFPLLVVGCFLAAVAGDQVGYLIGTKVGPSLFSRPNSRVFKHEHVERADHYFARYGPKTIVLARFVPVVRTFTPILAGVGRMRYRTFVAYNIVGAALWAVGVLSLGALLGDSIGASNVDKYLLPIIFGIIVISVLPALVELRRHRTRHAAGLPTSGSRHE